MEVMPLTKLLLMLWVTSKQYTTAGNPVNTKHFDNFHTMLRQRRRRWTDVVCH